MNLPELDEIQIYRILDENQAKAALEAGGYETILRTAPQGIIFVRHFCYLMGLSMLHRIRTLEQRVRAMEVEKNE